MTMDIYE